jgi:hypothetical protein
VKLYHDLDYGYFTSVRGGSSPLRRLTFKAGDATALEVEFFKSGTPYVPATVDELIFVIKDSYADGSDPYALIETADWEEISDSDEAFQVFSAPLNTATSEIRDALASAASITLKAELTATLDGAGPDTTATISCIIQNDLWKGDEGTPSATPEPDEDWVAHGHAQTLTSGQKTQARSNIGVECLIGTYSPLARQNITFAGMVLTEELPSGVSAENFGLTKNGKQKWTNTLFGDTNISVEYNGSAWEFIMNTIVLASKTSSADTPAGLTDWTLWDGVSQPTVTGGALVLSTTGLATGLRYRQGTSAPYSWWDYNGTSWEPRTYVGRPVAWSPALSAYRALTVDSDLAPTSIAFPYL